MIACPVCGDNARTCVHGHAPPLTAGQRIAGPALLLLLVLFAVCRVLEAIRGVL